MFLEAKKGIVLRGHRLSWFKKKKSLDKVRNNVRNVSLEDFEAFINIYGYIEMGGKHPKAIIGLHTMPYKRENPIKSCYVKELINIIDSL